MIYFNIASNLGSHLWKELWFEDNVGVFACVLAMLPRLLLSFSLRLVWHFLADSAVYCQEPRYYINHPESVPTDFATLLTLIINIALLLQKYYCELIPTCSISSLLWNSLSLKETFLQARLLGSRSQLF